MTAPAQVTPAWSRRAGATVALGAAVAALALLLRLVVAHPLGALLAVAGVLTATGAAAAALTRTGARRHLAAVAALTALLGIVAALFVVGDVVLALLSAALFVVASAAGRHALGRVLRPVLTPATAGVAVPPAERPVLLLNTGSGGGAVARLDLVAEARRRGIDAMVLTEADDLVALAEGAVARGADVIGMAGGDGSQALVAQVAMRHDVAYVCVPAGTRNHFAADLGLDRRDVVAALDAFSDAVEQRVDLGMVGDRPFVNNAALGLYARVVRSPAYRDGKVATALDLLPGMLGPGAVPFDLRYTGPDGTDHLSAHLILVSNGRYDLQTGGGFGSRRRLDSGVLGIVTASFASSRDIARLADLHLVGQEQRFRGLLDWTNPRFEVRSGAPIEVALDGEAMLLASPLRFQSIPRAVRVRIPTRAPGRSPAAVKAVLGWSTVTALARIAAGCAPDRS